MANPPEVKPPWKSAPEQPEIIPGKGRTKRLMEYLAGSAIFLITLVLFVMRFFIDRSNPAIFESYGDHYISYWYPLFNNVIMNLVGIFFLIKAWAFRSCVYNKIISTCFEVAQFISLTHIIFLYNWDKYINAWYFILYIGILFTCIIWLVNVLRTKNYDNI